MSAPEVVVVRGNPTDEELAAVLVVLAWSTAPETVRPATARPATRSPANGWSAYWRLIKAPPLPGPDAWRHSGRIG